MKKLMVILTTFSLLLYYCSCINPKNDRRESEIKKPSGTEITAKPDNYNISILLDLSDRIITPQTEPTQKQKDIIIVNTVVSLFKKNMQKKGAHLAKDKLRVIFSPTPNDPNINNIAEKLTVDLSQMGNKSKKEVYDNIENDFENGLTEIYDISINDSKWPGSDIWRFFKYDVDLCIESNPAYRNILIILTDGYLYHKQSEHVKDPDKSNRRAFITPTYLKSKGFWNNPGWKEKFENEDFGLISVNKNVSDLDVLVLEINPSPNHKNDQDIIRAFLTKWFTEMGVSASCLAMYDTDLPVNTRKRIELFFK